MDTRCYWVKIYLTRDIEWLKADAVQTLSLVYFLPRADSQYHRRHTDFLRQKQRQSGAVVFGGGGGVAANDSGLGRLRHLNGLGGGGIGGIGAVGGGIGGGLNGGFNGGGGGNGAMVGAGGIALTEYNPNYEFGGGTCSLQDLREIPRENLRLVK